MESINKFEHKDRNGLLLEYGDNVYLKSYWKNMYLHEVVGFTKNYVVFLTFRICTYTVACSYTSLDKYFFCNQKIFSGVLVLG